MIFNAVQPTVDVKNEQEKKVNYSHISISPVSETSGNRVCIFFLSFSKYMFVVSTLESSEVEEGKKRGGGEPQNGHLLQHKLSSKWMTPFPFLIK